MGKSINFYGQVSSVQHFDYIKINIASPEQIKSWSYGLVTKPETINYRTFKPEKDGLFCARIFGPTKDYECICGKYKRIKYRGIICEKCGVEVTTARVRRERMGHIDLATPIVHIWFFKSLPSRISLLLDMTLRDLEKILYLDSYVVIDPGLIPVQKGELISEDALKKLQDDHGEDNFTCQIGGEAIYNLLATLDLPTLALAIKSEILESNSEAKKKKLIKRLKLVEDFIDSGNKPEWMVMTVLPVIPPEIRPLVQLDGGRFATSDLNELYRRVINRNNRLKSLMKLKSPDIMIRNEKRMLQESVDALFDNGRRGKAVKGANKRPLKSLSDMLKGKQGRFRQNLLGKRVDYSGRSVIVVGPELKLHQCGLPKKMALELFKPFIYAKLEMYGIAHSIKVARKMVEAERPEVWDVLEEVIRQHPILLNRAPTLHRLSIQAFEPILIEGKAIQLHPLVCTAFNADFDGDQMAVHIPLSIEAQTEARVLMMSTNNILSPANGKPIIVADKDIVLGIYYLTLSLDNEPGENMIFSNMAEVQHALFNKVITIHTKIRYRIKKVLQDNKQNNVLIDITAGRLIFAQLLPDASSSDFNLVNKNLTKKDISGLIDHVYRYFGQKATVIFADRLMEMGFKYACSSGISFGLDDMITPKTKEKHVSETTNEVKEFEKQYTEGLITYGEKYNKIIDAWSRCTDKVTNDLMQEISKPFPKKTENETNQQSLNSIYMMANSGARGSANQIKQICGMRGLMATPSGEIIETPIISNFKEGLKVIEYFNSSHGARKGLADTALKTANSGYLTRRLVDVAQDCMITKEDCGTTNGLDISSVVDGVDVIVSLADRILGRVTAANVYHPVTNELILEANKLIDEVAIEKIETSGIDTIKIRSVLTCDLIHGVCSKCYGRDLASGSPVAIGETVGIIAAQSIGEPGTQLTMRTFHIGGAATRRAENSSIDSPIDGKIKVANANLVKNSKGEVIIMNRVCEIIFLDYNGLQKGTYKVPYGAKLLVEDGANITKRQKIAEWDAYSIPILSEKAGIARYQDLIEGVSIRDFTDENTGISKKLVTESRHHGSRTELKPRIDIYDQKGNPIKLPSGSEAKYYLPVNAILTIEDGAPISAGDSIARITRESTKTKDITGGLPRVVELVEARRPKDHAIIAETEGRIEFGKDYKTKRKIILHPLDGAEPVSYVLQKGKHVIPMDGDIVKKGDVIVDGHSVLQDILRVMGVAQLSEYMVEQIQSVYRLQGVKIDDKHIEVIIKQMLQKVEVMDVGDSTLSVGDKIDKIDLYELNKKLEQQNRKIVKGQEILQGITKASLQTRSFISAASFQETTRVLTEAAVAGKRDNLTGLKENVIVGRLIPAGTGHYVAEAYREAKKLEKQLDQEQKVID